MITREILRIDYLDLDEIDVSFLPVMDKLVNEVCEDKYKEIMQQHGIANEPIQWMKLVCQCMRYVILNNSRRKKITVREVGRLLSTLHYSQWVFNSQKGYLLFQVMVKVVEDYKILKSEVSLSTKIIELLIERLNNRFIFNGGAIADTAQEKKQMLEWIESSVKFVFREQFNFFVFRR